MATNGDHDVTGDGGTNDRVHATHHDWDRDGSIALSVVEAVAEATGREVTNLDPLYGTLDPDVLDRVVASLGPEGPGWVTFAYGGCHVSVTASGAIAIEPAD